MTCDGTARIHRYHDGELSPPERTHVETHLRQCGQCSRTLADLRRLSSLVSKAGLAEMPADAAARLHARWPQTRDRGIRRLAGWLTAAAAAVLIAALLARPADLGDTTSRPAIWQTVAVLPPTELHGDADSDLLVMAQWMADELSATGRR
ncbi:MAG TPA: zf-HC2 domain-containing protein [Phycisphaerae bacterium]|nr:zf-HC2 domain-containing protein [Phycisphaerae bacterium]